MANGWAPDGAVQDQIDDSLKDAVATARARMPAGDGLTQCEECGEPIPEARRRALPGARTCVPCQSRRDSRPAFAGITGAAAKTASCVRGPGPRSMTMAEADLFGVVREAPPPLPALPGLKCWREVISPAQEHELITRIDSSELEPFRFQGWLGKRLSRSFGWAYDFDNGRFEQAAPMPEWLLPVRDRAAASAGLAPDLLVQAILIRFDLGAGIGWHRDRPVFEDVVGLSLGSPATLRFRRRTQRGFDRTTHHADPRSLYHLAGEARHEWEHSIAAMSASRWSITFRSLAERPRSPRKQSSQSQRG